VVVAIVVLVVMMASFVSLLDFVNLQCSLDYAGGPELEQQCQEYIRRHGSLSCGEVFTSCSGRLPCKAVVHTVGPVWHNGTSNEDRDLEKAVRGALEACQKYRTVALPALSCGIYGFPPDLAAKITLREIRDFVTNDSSSLSRVDVVVLKKDVISEFQKALAATFGTEKVSNLSWTSASPAADSGCNYFCANKLRFFIASCFI